MASRSRDRGKAADGLTWPLTPMHYSVRSARSSVRPAIQITMPPRLLSSDYRQADCETGGKGGRTLATRINHGENQFNVKLSHSPFPDPDFLIVPRLLPSSDLMLAPDPATEGQSLTNCIRSCTPRRLSDCPLLANLELRAPLEVRFPPPKGDR